MCRRLQILYLFNVCVNTDGSEKFSDNSPGAASVTSFESTEFANDFAGLSFEEQERLRAEWNQVSLTILIITAILIDLFYSNVLYRNFRVSKKRSRLCERF